MDERKKLEPVASATEKKKSFGERLKETFIQEDIKEVGRHVTGDVIVPAIRKGFYETITSGLGMLLGIDQKKSSATVPGAQVSLVPYREFYERRNDSTRSPMRARTSYPVKDMIFDDRDSAEKVLESMNDLILATKSVSVADFLELCGYDPNYTDFKYGWVNLKNAGTYQTDDGYRIDLPRPEPLD